MSLKEVALKKSFSVRVDFEGGHRAEGVTGTRYELVTVRSSHCGGHPARTSASTSGEAPGFYGVAARISMTAVPTEKLSRALGPPSFLSSALSSPRRNCDYFRAAFDPSDKDKGVTSRFTTPDPPSFLPETSETLRSPSGRSSQWQAARRRYPCVVAERRTLQVERRLCHSEKPFVRNSHTPPPTDEPYNDRLPFPSSSESEDSVKDGNGSDRGGEGVEEREAGWCTRLGRTEVSRDTNSVEAARLESSARRRRGAWGAGTLSAGGVASVKLP
ncbi:hypothetical protein KM043_008760 [Ampulex compressa]|nr:hypothetical protein KM043_008760 [Ampulex compressa]